MTLQDTFISGTKEEIASEIVLSAGTSEKSSKIDKNIEEYRQYLLKTMLEYPGYSEVKSKVKIMREAVYSNND